MKINVFKILFGFIGFICFSFTPTDFTPFSKSSLLWKIEGNNIAKGSYLFGTMHLIEKDYFPNGAKILAIHTGGIQGIKGMNIYLKKKNLQQIITQ